MKNIPLSLVRRKQAASASRPACLQPGGSSAVDAASTRRRNEAEANSDGGGPALVRKARAGIIIARVLDFGPFGLNAVFACVSFPGVAALACVVGEGGEARVRLPPMQQSTTLK